MGRLEEAIIVLRKVVFFDYSLSSQKNLKEQQKIHLQLLQTYYTKKKSKKSQDVIYLIALFKKRYPKSNYLNLIKNWELKKE